MTSTSWLSRDLNVQALDKMRKLSDSEQTAYECWVYQENNQFFVTDLNTRLKVTINPKKLNKIKSQFVNKPNNTNLRSSTNSNSTVNSSSHELVRILVKQYLYSSMIDFKSKKKEPFVFMFLEDFDVSTGKNLAKKATDLNKLNIGSHPSVNRPTIAEKHPTSTNTNIVTRSASKTVLKENTPMATYSPKPSPMRVSDHLRAYTKQKTAEKQKSEKREEEEKTKEKQTSGSSNLSQLINQISQDSSLQDCTIEMIATTPTRMKTRRAAGLAENEKEKKKIEPMNLDEGFFKSGNTQSTLGSTMSSNHSDDLLLLDVESQQILDKKNGGLKLSSQCPTNFSQFDVNCSVISCAPDECSKSSIKITRKTSKAKVQATTVEEADPVDQEMRSCEDDENNRVENTVHVADKDETRIPPLSNPDRIIVRDTQAIAASNENGQTQNSPSQLIKRRDTVTSAISDMSTSIFEWPAPITAACSTMDAFTSSTLNYSLFGGAGGGIMCQPATTTTIGASATKRRKKKLFSQHDRACFNDDGDDDDDEEDDDLNDSASQYNCRSTHNTPSNARFSRAKMLSSKTASIQKALTPLPTTPSRRRRADESADSTERRSSSESGAGRNQGADDEAKRIRTLLTSSSSSSSTSSLVSFDDDLEEENSSCVTSATANTTNKAASALLFKPRHLFEYKRRLMARRAETERKPTLLTTVSSSASIASSRINNRLFSVRDIFSPSRYNPRKRTMTTITPPSSNRQQQLVNDTGSEPRHQQLLRANSRLLDNAVSLDLGPVNKDQNAQRFNSNTSQNSTPSRRRLFDPKNQDINHAFGVTTHPTAPTPSKKMNTLSIQTQRSISESRNNNTTTITTTTTTTSSNPDITSMNNTTATTTTTTSSDQTTATTSSSSDKSIPGGQYPNNQAVAANDTNNDTNKTTSILDPHSNIFDHKFSLNVDDFQDFLALKNSLVESSADHV